jgi:hypothetical protein
MKNMGNENIKSPDQIFADMHRELRAWNPDIPESPDRLDPILKILLRLYSSQLSKIDEKIDMVWKVATDSLIKSLCPESKRWPIPAYTVMRCQPTDPSVEVDPHVKFFYKEQREGGQTFYFSPQKSEKLILADVKYIFFRLGNTLVDLSPSDKESVSAFSRPRATSSGIDTGRVYMAVDYTGPSSDFTGVFLFLKGIPDALKQLRWAYWYPGTNEGRFYEDSGFCPGLVCNIEEMFAVDGRPVNWGGLRTSTDLFKTLEDNFVILPENFTSTWEMGPPDKELQDMISAADMESLPAGENFYWIRADLPRGGDKSSLHSSFGIYFNCFVAANKNELTLFKHTGGNRLVEVELPESIDSVLEVNKVVDSNGGTYIARHEMVGDSTQKSYSLEERGSKLVLWFDFSAGIDFPPDSITINYSVTAGVGANGIEAGKINELYESHPGVMSAENIIPTRGAIPAKTDKQVMLEVSSRLRNRDRALGFAEISNWAKTFDPRIVKAECANGVQRGRRGVRRCIIVRTAVKSGTFYSDDEIDLLKVRLNSFLKSRSPVNTHFEIEVEKV